MSYSNGNGGTGGTPAGWYADPAGSPQLRWWDGTQWTSHFQAPAQAQAPAYAPYTPAAAAPIPTVPPGTPVYNPFIWALTLLPLLSLLLLPLSFTEIDQAMSSSFNDPTSVNPYGGYSTGGLLIQGLTTLLSWLIYGAGVVLAFFDRKWLLAKGYAQPFHWAWAFLGVVYPIGRSVVVRRRAGRGIAPMWVTIGVLALSLILSVVVIATVFQSFMTAMTTYGSYT